MSLRVESVSKKYHQKKALDNISITFEKETIYGLLGRNGAGKTNMPIPRFFSINCRSTNKFIPFKTVARS